MSLREEPESEVKPLSCELGGGTKHAGVVFVKFGESPPVCLRMEHLGLAESPQKPESRDTSSDTVGHYVINQQGRPQMDKVELLNSRGAGSAGRRQVQPLSPMEDQPRLSS